MIRNNGNYFLYCSNLLLSQGEVITQEMIEEIYTVLMLTVIYHSTVYIHLILSVIACTRGIY